ncbi:MAG: SpoIVB peptidase S55 domain-containing protein [Acidobacteriota bacterium]|nr:SpoIVB peptidase S55 domain-containing protein [Acidobacteriota bacterium]
MEMPGTFRCRAAAIVAGLLVMALAAAASTPIMPLDQVKPGMKGKGRTVFTGTSIEEFDVEILGLLHNTNPKRDIIIARLSGHPALAGGGIISGMSGSPVYIDGKIIGAVAYGFAFSKEPIAGITPIGEMLAIPAPEAKPASPGGAPSLPLAARMGLEDLLAVPGSRLGPAAAGTAGGWAPLQVPLVLGGFAPGQVDRVRSLFEPLGFRAQLGGGQAVDKLLAADMTLAEGDAVALQLVTGDLDVSAVGTVTYVDGDKILAFGHPLYNLGGVGYGMAKAKVITVIPALDTPTKMAVTGAPVGSFVQDRTAGARGLLGRAPKMVPVNVNLTGDGAKLREFKLGIVVDKLLTPLLLNMCLSSLLGAEERALGDLTLDLQGDIFLDDGRSVHLEDMASANLGTAVTNLSGLVTAVTYYLTNNEWAEVGIHRIDLNIRTTEGQRTARLERVWLDKYEASPGEMITIRVYYRGYRGETRMEEVPFQMPRLPAGSELRLIIGDAASMVQVESGQYRAQGLTPRSLPQLIRLLGAIRKSNRIYFKVVTGKPGLFLRGEEMPNLPPGMKAMFLSPRSGTSSPTELTLSTLTEYQIPVPFVFSGSAVVPIQVRK